MITLFKNANLIDGISEELRPGYSADLLLVNSNPLESIENLKQVAYVMCRGSHVTHEWMCNLQ